ncbi:MAG: hypothetical protein OXU44_04485, partial [Gammaproteobacteria bacterium]|nr:hypothetical protein [Gammaproteobacteria bacterium]
MKVPQRADNTPRQAPLSPRVDGAFFVGGERRKMAVCAAPVAGLSVQKPLSAGKRLDNNGRGNNLHDNIPIYLYQSGGKQ